MSRAILVAQVHCAGISRTHKYLVRNGVRNSRFLDYVDVGTHCHLKCEADSYYIANKYPNKLRFDRFLLDNTNESKILNTDINNNLIFQYYVVIPDYKHTKSTMAAQSSSTIVKKSPPLINFPIADHELRCAICTELFINAITLNCCHTFCKFCVRKWKEAHTGCPICRTEILVESTTATLDNFINIIVEHGSQDMKQHRQIMITEREAIYASKPTEEVINISDSESFTDEEGETDYYDSNTTDDNNGNITEMENDN